MHKVRLVVPLFLVVLAIVICLASHEYAVECVLLHRDPRPALEPARDWHETPSSQACAYRSGRSQAVAHFIQRLAPPHASH